MAGIAFPGRGSNFGAGAGPVPRYKRLTLRSFFLCGGSKAPVYEVPGAFEFVADYHYL